MSLGITEPAYLAGAVLQRNSSNISERILYAESAERLADSSIAVDRPIPYEGAELVTRKYSFALSFPAVGEADYRIFTRIQASPDPFSFCIWKPITETFIGDGSRATFTLGRRLALSAIPSNLLPLNAATKYATEVTVNGTVLTPSTDYTFGTSDALGRTLVTLTNTPQAGAVVEVYYVPLFLMRRVGDETSYGMPNSQTRQITLEEAA